jgi:Tfp pilus assembly protein PilN
MRWASLTLLALALGSVATADTATDSARVLLEPLLPAGSNIQEIKANGTRIEIRGHAASNAGVSAFLRSIDSSPELERPELMEIAMDGNQYRYVISLTLPCLADKACKGSAPAKQTVHKCTVNGVVTFQATPCPE